MNENILNEESNTLTENLVRIRDAANDMRATVEMTSENSIEDVADAVSDLKAENEQLKYDLEHCEDRVFNEYYNMNLDECENWRDLEKKGIPYHANGATNLANFFAYYPGKYIKVIGEWGKPTDINHMFDQCQAVDIDIPLIDTSLTENFEYTLCNCRADVSTVQRWINNWDTSHATTMTGCFSNYTQGTKEHKLDVSDINISNFNHLSNMFSSASNITGFENWDISHIHNFDSTFSGFAPEYDDNTITKEATIDLTNWEKTFAVDNWVNFYGMFSGCRARRIIMPNIDTSANSDNASFAYLCNSCRYLEYADFRKLVFNENNMYSAFDDMNPICAIIVKDATEKQKIINQWSYLKCVYTPEEYEEREETTVHFDFKNWDDEEVYNNAYYYISIWDEDSSNWHWVTYDWMTYTKDTEYITLPKNQKFRIGGAIENWGFQDTEFETLEDTMTVSIQGGVPHYNYNITINDNYGNLLTAPMELYKKVRWEDEWEYYGLSENGHGQVRFTYNDYGYILVKDPEHFYQSYNINTGSMTRDKTGTAYMYPIMINVRSALYYDNGEILPAVDLTYNYTIKVNGNRCYYYNNPYEFGTSLSYKDVVQQDLTCTCIFQLNSSDYYTQTFTKDDVVISEDGYQAYWDMDNISMPTPNYNNLTVYIRDQETGELINPDIISKVYVYDSSYCSDRRYFQYENPGTVSVPNNRSYNVQCERCGELYEGVTDWVYIEATDTNITLNLPKLVHFNIDYKKANGEFVDYGDYKDYKIVAFNQNDEYMWMDGSGTWDYGQTYHFDKSKEAFENVAYVRVGVWDNRLNESNGGFVANPNIIAYNPNILTYAVTVQQCDDPIVWTEDPETGAYTTTNRQVVEDLRMEMCSCGPGWGSMRLDENNRFIHYYNMPVNVLDTDYRITKCWQMGTGDEGTTVPIVSIQTINGTETVKVEND